MRRHPRLRAPGVDLQDKERLAFHEGQGDLGEAPWRGAVAVAAQRQRRLAGAQLGVERALPADTGLDADVAVQTEEHEVVPLPGQAGLEFERSRSIVAAVTAEQVAHAGALVLAGATASGPLNRRATESGDRGRALRTHGIAVHAGQYPPRPPGIWVGAGRLGQRQRALAPVWARGMAPPPDFRDVTDLAPEKRSP